MNQKILICTFSITAVLIIAITGIIFIYGQTSSDALQSTLYTLPGVGKVNEEFARQHPFLTEIVRVTFWSRAGKIARSTKPLEKSEIIRVVEDLIANGYVQMDGLFQTVTIKERNVTELPDSIIIRDTGVHTTMNDAPPYGKYSSKVTLEYQYVKSNNTIQGSRYSRNSSGTCGPNNVSGRDSS